MNRQAEAMVHLVMAAVIMAVLSIAAYFIGCQLAGGIIADAAAAGSEVPNLSDWKDYYYMLVRNVGLATGAVLLLWTAMSHWILSSSGSKRWIWLVLCFIVAAICIGYPVLFVKSHPLFISDISIPALFFVCYCLLGYWLGSILVTSDKHKYTPLLAGFLRVGA